jgi:hypothetical protein
VPTPKKRIGSGGPFESASGVNSRPLENRFPAQTWL